MFGLEIKLLDRYALIARMLPAGFVWAPAAPLGVALVPMLPGRNVVVLMLAMAFAFTILFAELARMLGRRAEARLFRQWGGMPTTIWLRHQDNHLDPITKARYHDWLAAHVPGWRVPTQALEESDPDKVDQQYTSAVNWLRAQTRDTSRYHLVHEENITYGYRRNLYGLKPVGVTSALLLLVAGSVISVQQWLMGTSPAFYLIMVTLMSLVWLGIWALVVRPGWVKDSAEAYARALLACCDQGTSQSL